MDFANDGDLFQKISKYKKSRHTFTEEQVWRIAIGVVAGLKRLHDLKVLHRDIKSANVFLDKNGVARLGDMNVSKVAKAGYLYTQTGTPYYASPEVWNDKPYNSKSDIWSLGCVLYETLTLHPPFRAENMDALFKRVCKGHFEEPPDRYSPELKRLIKSMIVVKPDLRPSAEQILQSRDVAQAMHQYHIIDPESMTQRPVSQEANEDELLKTIHMPRNLKKLEQRLPRA